MKRIINANHFGIWGDLRRAAEAAATRRLIVREASDGHAIEWTGPRRDGDATYVGLEFAGVQSTEIELILAAHCEP